MMIYLLLFLEHHARHQIQLSCFNYESLQLADLIFLLFVEPTGALSFRFHQIELIAGHQQASAKNISFTLTGFPS